MSTTSELCAERLMPPRDVGLYSLSLQHTEPRGNSTKRVLSDRSLLQRPARRRRAATTIVISP